MKGSKGISNPIWYIAILNKMSHLQFISTHDGQIKIITYVNPIAFNYLDSSGKQAYKIICKQNPSIVVKCMNCFFSKNRKNITNFTSIWLVKKRWMQSTQIWSRGHKPCPSLWTNKHSHGLEHSDANGSWKSIIGHVSTHASRCASRPSLCYSFKCICK